MHDELTIWQWALQVDGLARKAVLSMHCSHLNLPDLLVGWQPQQIGVAATCSFCCGLDAKHSWAPHRTIGRLQAQWGVATRPTVLPCRSEGPSAAPEEKSQRGEEPGRREPEGTPRQGPGKGYTQADNQTTKGPGAYLVDAHLAKWRGAPIFKYKCLRRTGSVALSRLALGQQDS